MASRVVRVVAIFALGAGAGTACSPGETAPVRAAAARPSASPVVLESIAGDVHKYVSQVWPRTSRIWPGMDFSRHVLLLSDGKQTVAIDTASRQRVAPGALKAAKVSIPAPGGFAMAEWKGKNAVIYRLPTASAAAQLREETTGLTSPNVPAFAFELATHEQFHSYVQLGKQPWASLGKLSESEDGRDELYPLQAEPRLQRAMVYNSLLSAYQQPEQRKKHLAAAAYWHDQWATKYPKEQEIQAGTDLLEGTTQYVETLAGAMALAKDPENADQVRKVLVNTMKPLKVASKSDEPYAIGAAALLNAAAMGQAQVKRELTNEAATPASKVLDGITPSPQADPADLKRSITVSVTEQNKKLAATIEPFIKGMQNKKSWILMLPDDALQGSMDAEFYTTDELPISIKNKATANFRTPSGPITLDEATTAELKKNGKTYYPVPLDPSSDKLSLKGNKLTLKDKHLAGTVTVTAKTENGQRFLYTR